MAVRGVDLQVTYRRLLSLKVKVSSATIGLDGNTTKNGVDNDWVMATMSESWDDHADGWDENAAVIEYSVKAYRSLLEVVDPQGLRVLDFGCGTGLLAEKIAPTAACVLAIDPSVRMIEILNAKNIAKVETYTNELSRELVRANPTSFNGFDLIVASSALAFVQDYPGTVGLLRQISAPDGLFVQWDWLKQDDVDGAGFTRETIETTLKAAGFCDVRTCIAFSMQGQDGSMPVLMGVARNP